MTQWHLVQWCRGWNDTEKSIYLMIASLVPVTVLRLLIVAPFYSVNYAQFNLIENWTLDLTFSNKVDDAHDFVLKSLDPVLPLGREFHAFPLAS